MRISDEMFIRLITESNAVAKIKTETETIQLKSYGDVVREVIKEKHYYIEFKNGKKLNTYFNSVDEILEEMLNNKYLISQTLYTI